MNAITVDDHPLVHIVIRSLPDASGTVMITELDSGDQVVQAAEKAKPELLITDADIPGISGIEVLEQLRKRYYIGAIIIILAKNEFFYGRRSAEYGASGSMNKKEGMNNTLTAVEATKNGYGYFPFFLEHFTGSSVNEQDKLDMLSSQEMRVLRCILNGTDYGTIASGMNISNKTVSTYKSWLMEKLDCSSLVGIYDYAQRNEIGRSNAGTPFYFFDGHFHHRIIYGCKLSPAS